MRRMTGRTDGRAGGRGWFLKANHCCHSANHFTHPPNHFAHPANHPSQPRNRSPNPPTHFAHTPNYVILMLGDQTLLKKGRAGYGAGMAQG